MLQRFREQSDKAFLIDNIVMSLFAATLLGCSAGNSTTPPPPPPPPKGQITFSFGAEETVFSYATDSCEALDVPDTRAHAVRFEKAFSDRSNGLVFLKAEPGLDDLRSNARFVALQQKLNFPK